MNFVAELAIILVAAGVFTIISKALKQPIILGYIVAGFLVGPHLGLIPGIEMEGVEQWSEIGIIFLLFALGLEFSFKKLIKVGGGAIITAGVKCIGMFIVGMVAANLMGWSQMEGIFLGGLLSMSSTTIIIKAYDDMGLKQRAHSPILFGSLVVEDLIAVLLLVLLSTLASSNSFSGGAMLASLLKLVFFIILWFLVGIFIIPRFLKWAHKFLSDEILLITSIGLCFLMVTLAELVDFSSALGAFVMGSILSETLEGERIERVTTHIKDLFGAIFFVSVGMMVDPAVIGAHWQPILVITLVAMGGILIFSTTGALIAGQGLENSVHIGFSLAQLGEFAFIIASLGCSLGVMQDFIYPVIIAVSVITTFTTPYMIKAADPVSRWLGRVLPTSLVSRLTPAPEDHAETSEAERNEWKAYLMQVLLRMVLYGVVLIAVIVAGLFIRVGIHKFFPNMDTQVVSWVSMVVTLLLMTPFLYGFVSDNKKGKASMKRLLVEHRVNRFFILSIFVLRYAIVFFMIFLLAVTILKATVWAYLLLVICLVALIVVGHRSNSKLSVVENQFFDSLNQKEQLFQQQNPIAASIQQKLATYDVHLEEVTISSDFMDAGKLMREMPFRHTCDANVVKIIRGSRGILIPRGDEPILPGDILGVVGTTEQIEQFRQLVGSRVYTPEDGHQDSDYDLIHIRLHEDSYLTGKTLRQAKMRSSNCMVVSVMRDGQIITNPKPDFCLQMGDHVWIAGEKSSCQWYER